MILGSVTQLKYQGVKKFTLVTCWVRSNPCEIIHRGQNDHWKPRKTQSSSSSNIFGRRSCYVSPEMTKMAAMTLTLKISN